MKIMIQSLRFDADKKLQDFIQKKMSKIEKLWDAPSVMEVVLRIENDASEENKVVEVKIPIPGSTDIFARKQSRTFEEAIDDLVDILSRQVMKAKEKARGL
jgi:ribosomal subunit interface protein